MKFAVVVPEPILKSLIEAQRARVYDIIPPSTNYVHILFPTTPASRSVIDANEEISGRWPLGADHRL